MLLAWLMMTVAVAVGAQPQRPLSAVAPEEVPAPGANAVTFTPPDWSTVPDTPLGDMVRIGRDVFVDTQRYATDGAYPGDRNNQVNTFEQRHEGCFRFSMNGTMPPADSLVVVSLVSYAFWLATGAPVGAQLAGRGFPAVAQPALAPSVARGADFYQGALRGLSPGRWRRAAGGWSIHVPAGMGSRFVQQRRRHAPDAHRGRVHQGEHAAGAGRHADRPAGVGCRCVYRQQTAAAGSADSTPCAEMTPGAAREGAT